MTTSQKITLGVLLTLMAIYLAYDYRQKIAPSLYAGDSKLVWDSTGVLPNPQLTPGVTNPDINQGNIDQNICNKNWSTKSIRPSSSYTTKLKIKQIKEYGYQNTKTADFEEDHLISLELGGNATDPDNLWPQSYNTNPNARDKDKVEHYLHTQICSGSITLTEAQKEISTNWVEVYNRMSKSVVFGSVNELDEDDN